MMLNPVCTDLLNKKVQKIAEIYLHKKSFAVKDIGLVSYFLKEAGEYLRDDLMVDKASALLLKTEVALVKDDTISISTMGTPLISIFMLKLQLGKEFNVPTQLTKKVIDCLHQSSKDLWHDLIFGLPGLALAFKDNSEINKVAIDFLKSHLQIFEGLEAYRCHTSFSLGETAEARKFPRFNLGLAHGVAGVLSFLCSQREEEIAERIANTILNVSKAYPGNFPPVWPIPTNQDISSDWQNGWCYGDASVGISLLRFARTFPRNKLAENALVTGIQRIRRSLSDDQPKFFEKDPHFCHGTSGLIQIAWRAYELTGEFDIIQSAEKWILQSYGPEGMIKKSPTLWANELLEGELGPALVALTYLRGQSGEWDSIFGLS